ncbi:FecCD family ABC transporter permease [Larsenimonas rhizosphaerae]|uniref:Iron ABC transporter permease n=1 Tax=Larsenimonas rhizosphaerae TaxID=2944682 RepID=A0AA41ZKS1_9GAMM|nr:iron ABC transporter permease [Larsenimonas rhizosphaerae]MCM2130869.1 iron ABC transporter permease [Larsenimonas rhizosphaerae]MCX2523573.1 iron ABC transporter permease [Larsenimonas rhizosphaerae]
MTSSLTQAGLEDASLVRYRRQILHRSLLLILLMVLAAVALVADIMIGSGTLSFGQVLKGLVDPGAVSDSTRVIIWQLRMPMTVMAVLAGMGLALAGLLMQIVLNNPLAEPLTLGISSAAGFGASLALAFNTSVLSALPFLNESLVVAGNAFFFSLITVGLILLLAGRQMGLQTITLLGIAIHFVFSALLGLVQYLATADQLQSMVFWMMGSLLRASWDKVQLTAVVIGVVVPLVLLKAWALTALRSFGDEAAVFGINVRRLRILMLVAAAVMAGAVTSVVGIIGFVGLVAPHVARMMVGEDQRFLVGVTLACGAIFMTVASLVSKLVVPGVALPIGMVTSLIGLPFFIILIIRDQRLSAR